MCLPGTESTKSCCSSARPHTGRSLASPFPCVPASSGTTGSQPSAGNSAPVDTRGENTKTHWPLDMAESQGRCSSQTLTQNFPSDYEQRFTGGAAQTFERIFFLLSNLINTQKKNVQVPFDKYTTHSW